MLNLGGGVKDEVVEEEEEEEEVKEILIQVKKTMNPPPNVKEWMFIQRIATKKQRRESIRKKIYWKYQYN